ncbi:DUF5652 family protein [Candidatus Parcubacteria bacterium]|nr:DUF5652 family protein [Candidatus Parcubacteria bacterium]
MQTLPSLTGLPLLAIVLVVLWSLVWKGFALWRAAELRQKWWFIALLIVNTLGLLEIIYLFFVARRYTVLMEVIEEK